MDSLKSIVLGLLALGSIGGVIWLFWWVGGAKTLFVLLIILLTVFFSFLLGEEIRKL